MLRSTSLYEKTISGNIIPDKEIILGDFGNIALVTIGDDVFPKYAWLLKGYSEDPKQRYPKQRYFNTKLCSARVVTENTYGMLKGRYRILYKKTECRLKNLKYVIMACVMLHNLCISVRDTYLPRWRLQVKQPGVIRKGCERKEDKNASELNRLKISYWLSNN